VVVNVLLNYVLVFGFSPLHFSGWGFVGSPIATSISRILLFVSFLFYTFAAKGYHRPTWCPWSAECLRRHRVLRLLRQSLPVRFVY
jgi:Na+-driven multidrug efflux pump